MACYANNPSSWPIFKKRRITRRFPMRRRIILRDEPAKYMRPKVVTEIIDEILPEADRGKLLLRFVN